VSVSGPGLAPQLASARESRAGRAAGVPVALAPLALAGGVAYLLKVVYPWGQSPGLVCRPWGPWAAFPM
jgi:hypothetical protein